jgi:hypothetical protein
MRDHPVLTRLANTGMRSAVALRRSSHARNPHLGYPVIHVAGTNGKGRRAHARRDAPAAWLKVGAYTVAAPPTVNEASRRGSDIDDDALSELLERIDGSAAPGPRGRIRPEPTLTYFEIATAAAFAYFLDQKVDVAVLEVGLGGGSMRRTSFRSRSPPRSRRSEWTTWRSSGTTSRASPPRRPESSSRACPSSSGRSRRPPRRSCARSPPIAAPSSTSAGRTACRKVRRLLVQLR